MDLGLKDKVAVVGGSSLGLGRACAMGLAEEGARVVVSSRNEERLHETAEEIRSKTGAQVLAVPTDMSKAEDIENLIDRTVDEFGRIDCLVNNAGGPPAGLFMEQGEDQWELGWKLTFMSMVRSSTKVVPIMQRQGGGSIVNITSLSVKQPVDSLILSNSYRAGVVGVAKTMANELGQYNIRINNVCPGYIRTQRLESLLAGRGEKTGQSLEEVIDDISGDVPLGRPGKPDELADMVVFLSSDRARYVTGVTVQVDGGVVKGLM